MNHPLFIKVKSLVGKERQIQAEILRLLEEIYSKGLYREWGFSSLFALCTDGLGYSESAAQRRIATLKLTRLAPEINAKIADGSLNLTTAAQIHTTYKQLDSTEALPSLIAAAEHKSTREAEKALLQVAKKFEPEFSMETLVNLRINKAAAEAMERLRAHFSHAMLSDSEIILRLGQKVLAQKPTLLPAPAVNENPRKIPAQTRRYIFQRDKTCTYQYEGRRCNSSHFLQIDHMHPVTLGGTSSPENLRLLCGAHNRLVAETMGLLRPNH